MSAPDQLIQFLDYHYCTICPSCRSKVMDPDKKKGQVYLKGSKCPSCSKDPKEEKKSKKERKKEKKEQERLRKLECRAKY